MVNSVFTGYNVHIQDLVSTWLLLMTAIVIITFIVSEITRNYSQVDKLWSLLPIAYAWLTVSFYPYSRSYIMASLVTIWGFRLSYNFWRKGGYNIIPWKGEEDYRWKILRDNRVLKGRLRFESISSKKYPLYETYKKEVPKFIPRLFNL